MEAKELEAGLRNNLAGIDIAAFKDNKDSISAWLHVMGMYDLGTDAAKADKMNEAETLERLRRAFGDNSLGNFVIDELNPETVEFECLYGTSDAVTEEKGRDITFIVRDKTGGTPVYLEPGQITAEFGISEVPDDVTWEVKSCEHDFALKATRVTLTVFIGGEAFFSEGGFIMGVEASMNGQKLRRVVRFKVRNTFPTFFRDSIAGRAIANTRRGRKPEHAERAKKPLIEIEGIVKAQKRDTKITFDKNRGTGEPEAICSNSAFRVAAISPLAMTIRFEDGVYQNTSSKLKKAGINQRLAPETSVWVEWEDKIVIYNIQYKKFVPQNR
jgi:hypothetical protein